MPNDRLCCAVQVNLKLRSRFAQSTREVVSVVHCLLSSYIYLSCSSCPQWQLNLVSSAQVQNAACDVGARSVRPHQYYERRRTHQVSTRGLGQAGLLSLVFLLLLVWVSRVVVIPVMFFIAECMFFIAECTRNFSQQRLRGRSWITWGV